jgi:3D (Asp-Asp-Asp) domain-containing protein
MVQRFISSIVIASLFSPMMAVAADTSVAVPHEQDFILTAYYSPLPNQCCYIKGSEDADKLLNGNGLKGADGTAVYPGMLAGPPSYAFGTRIVLPGLGTMTVHDRGGAIQVLDQADRLDVWAGFGEEGLARALAFGVKHIHGTVYPPSAAQPDESINRSAETLYCCRCRNSGHATKGW